MNDLRVSIVQGETRWHDPAANREYYGHLIVEELVAPATPVGQRNESPERGLDAETPSHTEAERARQRS